MIKVILYYLHCVCDVFLVRNKTTDSWFKPEKHSLYIYIYHLWSSVFKVFRLRVKEEITNWKDESVQKKQSGRCDAVERRRSGNFVSLLPVNGGRGAGLQPQQLWDWSVAALEEVQACDPLHVSDARLMEPNVVLNPQRRVAAALWTPNTTGRLTKPQIPDSCSTMVEEKEWSVPQGLSLTVSESMVQSCL